MVLNATLYNEDALKVLDTMPSESVDMVFSDVPYKTTTRGNAGAMGGFWTTDLVNKGKIFENNDVSPSAYLPQLYRVLKDGSHCYIMTNNLNLQEMLNEGVKAGFRFVKSLIWDKGNLICGTYYMGAFEYILLFRKGKDRPINNCGTPDLLSVPVKKMKDRDGNNLHDTEKPVDLMKIIIENASYPDEVVLDPFMGIGSTGVASLLTGRKFIGCEIDKRYYDIACQRCEDAEKKINNRGLDAWL